MRSSFYVKSYQTVSFKSNLPSGHRYETFDNRTPLTRRSLNSRTPGFLYDALAR